MPDGFLDVPVVHLRSQDAAAESASDKPAADDWPGIVEPDSELRARRHDLVGALARVLPLGDPAVRGGELPDIVEEGGTRGPVLAVEQSVNLDVSKLPQLGNAPRERRLARPGDARDQNARRPERQRIDGGEHLRILTTE